MYKVFTGAYPGIQNIKSHWILTLEIGKPSIVMQELRKCESEWPTFTAKKLRPLSWAKAFAIMVFEHPGGP